MIIDKSKQKTYYPALVYIRQLCLCCSELEADFTHGLFNTL